MRVAFCAMAPSASPTFPYAFSYLVGLQTSR